MQGSDKILKNKEFEKREVKKMKKILMLSLVMGVVLCLFAINSAEALVGTQVNPYANATGVPRVNGLWVYRGGALIGVDDFASGRFITYVNGRPIYQKQLLPPDVDNSNTVIKFVVEDPDGTGPLQGGTYIVNMTLRKFWGWDESDQFALEKYLQSQMSGLSDADAKKIANAIREQVAQGLSVGAGGLNPELLNVSEAFYRYGNSGMLEQITRDAIDQNGNVIVGKQSIDRYVAGLLTTRENWIFNYVYGTDGRPEEDPNGGYKLDKTNPIKIEENFYYEYGVQTGSKTFAVNDFQVSAKDLEGTTHTWTVAAGTILAETKNDAFGRLAEEHGVLKVDALAESLIVGKTTEHIYGTFGREIQTKRYFDADGNKIEVTDRTYNGNGQLANVNTKLLQDPYTDEKGNLKYAKVYDTEKTTYQYNSLGQIYYADAQNFQDGSKDRIYYVYNRELVKFNLIPPTVKEPNNTTSVTTTTTSALDAGQQDRLGTVKAQSSDLQTMSQSQLEQWALDNRYKDWRAAWVIQGNEFYNRLLHIYNMDQATDLHALTGGKKNFNSDLTNYPEARAALLNWVMTNNSKNPLGSSDWRANFVLGI